MNFGEVTCNVHCIYFNRQCLEQNLVPNYTKISNKSKMSKYTQRKIRKLRLREEIKFLHMKKGKLNIDLYHTPVKGANEWSKLWYHIEDKINETVSKEIGKKYKTVDAKI